MSNIFSNNLSTFLFMYSLYILRNLSFMVDENLTTYKETSIVLRLFKSPLFNRPMCASFKFPGASWPEIMKKYSPTKILISLLGKVD